MTQEMERNAAGMPVRELGKTGLRVSIIGFGGAHYIRPHLDEQASVQLIHSAIEAGVTFMDNAWEYHQGESERRMGLALKGRRDQVTLMTKVCGRDRHQNQIANGRGAIARQSASAANRRHRCLAISRDQLRQRS